MTDEHKQLREWFWEHYEDKTTEANYFAVENKISMDCFKQMETLKLEMLGKMEAIAP